MGQKSCLFPFLLLHHYMQWCWIDWQDSLWKSGLLFKKWINIINGFWSGKGHSSLHKESYLWGTDWVENKDSKNSDIFFKMSDIVFLCVTIYCKFKGVDHTSNQLLYSVKSQKLTIICKGGFHLVNSSTLMWNFKQHRPNIYCPKSQVHPDII